MAKKAVVTIVIGTRPEVIKLAPVIRWLQQRRGLVKVNVCVTAQHRELLDQMMAVFDLRSRVDLNVMRAGQSPLQVLRDVLSGLESSLKKDRPGMLVVQGDTTTALAGALAGFHMKVPVAHVEAGLRSFDKHNPFPEEGNRVLTDHLSQLLFAPTRQAKENLINESIPADKIFLTGNTVVDALHWSLERLDSAPPEISPPSAPPYLLATIHRRESFGKPVEAIFRALLTLVDECDDLRICYPVHPNPNVKRRAHQMLTHPRISLLPPLPYLEFIKLMRGARLIITDSGGIVEEAATLHKPVVVVREVTERPELVRSGGAVLSGTRTATIVRDARRILSDGGTYRRMSEVANPYGDGEAAARIGKAILRHLGFRVPKPEEFLNERARTGNLQIFRAA